MKLQINYSANKNIQGFTNLNILSPSISTEISDIAPLSCETVIASECLQMLVKEEVAPLLELISSRIRTNGEISISVMNFDAIATNYINGLLGDEDASNLIQNCRCVLSVPEIVEVLEKEGIKIYSIVNENNFCLIDGHRNEAKV